MEDSAALTQSSDLAKSSRGVYGPRCGNFLENLAEGKVMATKKKKAKKKAAYKKASSKKKTKKPVKKAARKPAKKPPKKVAKKRAAAKPKAKPVEEPAEEATVIVERDEYVIEEEGDGEGEPEEFAGDDFDEDNGNRL
jgi:hypothetical protein